MKNFIKFIYRSLLVLIGLCFLLLPVFVLTKIPGEDMQVLGIEYQTHCRVMLLLIGCVIAMHIAFRDILFPDWRVKRKEEEMLNGNNPWY